MARFFPASDPAIERHFAMLDAAAVSACKDEVEAWEHTSREGIRSSHGHYFRDVEPRALESSRKEPREGIRSSHGGSFFRDIEWGAAKTTDRASESARGVRPRSDPPHTRRESARNRWPIGGSFALGASGATSRGASSRGGASKKSPLQAYRAAVHQALGTSSDSDGAGTSISCATPSLTAVVAGGAEPSSVRRSTTCTALPAAGSSQVSDSRQESPTSPLLFVAGRSPSGTSTSSSESTPSEMPSVGKNTKPGSELKGRIIAGDRAVKVVGGANPAAVELYFKRKVLEGARASAPAPRPAAALAAVGGS